MKKLFMLLSWVLYIALSACSPQEEYDPYDTAPAGELTINLAFDEDPLTKAVTAYTTAQTYEQQVNSVQVLVFDSSGALNVYKDMSTTISGITISTTAGTKTVWAVVNGPDLSAITNLSSLQSKAIDLSANSTTANTGFVMAGFSTCTVGTSTVNTTISVRRLVARVALQKITNALPISYGSMTINNVTLINVVGNQNLAGSASINTWYNKMGRKDGATSSSHIIDGSSYLASCPSLTFKNVGTSIANGGELEPSTPYLFYTYPNSTSTDAEGWSTSFSARKTRLVVAATIGGTKYYYPVVIDTPARNYAYTVELTITGPGSTDPDKPVSKGSISASISVQGWSTGTTYEETI